VLILFIPFKYFSKNIGFHNIEKPKYNPGQRKCLIQIRRVAIGLQKYWPISFQCLTWTMAVSKILRANKVPYEFYLGVKKQNKKLTAHSWILSDGVFVTGHTKEKYTEVGEFIYLSKNDIKKDVFQYNHI
jgi:hypothetical protein